MSKKYESKRHELSYDDIKAKRIATCIKNKINFISGTVTPASSNKTKNKDFIAEDIECLETGLDFIVKLYNKITLSVQPKFMGSRINMYLFRDDHQTKSYCVTRNGYICNISRERLKPIYDVMRNRLNKFMTDNKIKMVILDGELLPWSALGSGLIENEFLPVDQGLKTEIEYSQLYNFDLQLKKIHSSIKHPQLTSASAEDAVKHYEKFKDLLNVPNEKISQEMYNVYHQQMRLYADFDTNTKQVEKKVEDNTNNNQELSYKAFGILKICFDDGSESVPLVDQLYSQSEMYDLVYDPDCEEDKQITVELNKENIQEVLTKIKKYFDKLTYEKGFEGIMLKPDYVKPGSLPMMKCRNTSYLTIIYGYDYKLEPKLTRLIMTKSTANKIKQSIREFQDGMNMLKINYNEIGIDNNYEKTMLKFIYNEESGASLDPRL